MTARGRWWLPVAVLVVAASCGDPTAGRTATTRPAEKTTCPEAVLATGPDLELVDRRLVPFTPTLLGVEATYSSSAGSLFVVSGGYLDDVLEAYDDLEPVGFTPVVDAEAGLLGGEFFDEPLWAAVWLDAAAASPCDVHLVLGQGMGEAAFRASLSEVSMLPTRTP